jgi:hypothetical protein
MLELELELELELGLKLGLGLGLVSLSDASSSTVGMAVPSHLQSQSHGMTRSNIDVFSTTGAGFDAKMVSAAFCKRAAR